MAEEYFIIKTNEPFGHLSFTSPILPILRHRRLQAVRERKVPDDRVQREPVHLVHEPDYPEPANE